MPRQHQVMKSNQKLLKSLCKAAPTPSSRKKKKKWIKNQSINQLSWKGYSRTGSTTAPHRCPYPIYFNLGAAVCRLFVKNKQILSNLKWYAYMLLPGYAFFSRTSQGHNALPRLGLEPGSSDSEPSALTTGLPNKAVALACPRTVDHAC